MKYLKLFENYSDQRKIIHKSIPILINQIKKIFKKNGFYDIDVVSWELNKNAIVLNNFIKNDIK